MNSVDRSPTLSILVCSVSERSGRTPVIDKLFNQADGLPVEVIVLTDNRSMSIGAKRNALLAASSGLYVSYVDDDDDVADGYCSDILEASEQNTDVICFDIDYVRNGIKQWTVSHSIYYVDEPVSVESTYDRKIKNTPRHTSFVRRDLATRIPFADTSYGEDAVWARELKDLAKTEAVIPKTLYYYLDNPGQSIARQYAGTDSAAYREWKNSK